MFFNNGWFIQENIQVKFAKNLAYFIFFNEKSVEYLINWNS
jgi:hypothetical protein